MNGDSWGAWVDGDYMTMILIPRRWWSIKDWKFAWEVRANMMKAFMWCWREYIKSGGAR